MKIRKIFSGIWLLALFLAGFMPAAQAALVNNPSQPVGLLYNPGSGETIDTLPFSKLMQVKSDGTSVPFVLPPNQELVVTYIYFNIAAATQSLTTKPTCAWALSIPGRR